MRLLSLFIIYSLMYCVSCKNNVKSLTESMGQEIIEVGDTLKGLPPDIDEEPSAEVDDEDVKDVTSTLKPSPVTKKEVKKTTTLETRRKGKDIDKIDDTQDDEEARIEKELAEIYKDNDYKEVVADPLKGIVNNTAEGKNIARARNNFKFQPDLNNKKEVERFRTSVDEISCDRSVTKKLVLIKDKVNNSSTFNSSGSFVFLLLILIVNCIFR